MDTATAAQTTGRTVATIRNWCRTGVVAATKTAGRWDIDATSLRTRVLIEQRRHFARRTHTPTWRITHTCGHDTWLRWHALPGATTRPCFTCSHKADTIQRMARENTTRQHLAQRYGHGRPATARQLDYLRSLARRAADSHRLPPNYPADDAHLLTSAGASHWIDTLKPLATPGRRSIRCECPSGRYGGVCTCC
ncbi:hypothetical protein [Streptomyces aidingensis]|uniref:Uncharacterized protein n=1 Tax=Streptomyces aidingensis TaxID=910347 RepID=A0A1I1PY35_9ACTN|nr:hypothetical protein [Streptomyces aidingensis]SFD14617.1 hypothetical protein SAMN05421773_110130 [Streptomyces aidingensis]